MLKLPFIGSKFTRTEKDLLRQHVVAVTANPSAAVKLGIPKEISSPYGIGLGEDSLFVLLSALQ